VTTPNRPVVLIAEKLAPSVLDVFADEFDVQHVDGTDRQALFDPQPSTPSRC
jgi:D-3-phosphoglycerate dehydrogenase